jgi:hypothetical protein
MTTKALEPGFFGRGDIPRTEKGLTSTEGSCKRAQTRAKGFSVKYVNSSNVYYYWFYYKTGLPELR